MTLIQKKLRVVVETSETKPALNYFYCNKTTCQEQNSKSVLIPATFVFTRPMVTSHEVYCELYYCSKNERQEQ